MQDKDQLFDRLLTEYISQTISSGDKETLFSLVCESEVYRKRFEEIARLNTFLRLPHFHSNKEQDALRLEKEMRICSDHKKKERTGYGYSRFMKVAAAALLFFLISFGSIYIYKQTGETNVIAGQIEIATPTGGKTRLVLPDGSIAWINSKSELKYGRGFGTTDRRLYLKGEGYFEVSKKQDLPFSVSAGDMEIIATGTVFNVRSYADDKKWEVDLLEGGVDVLISDKRYSLESNEKIVYDKKSASVTIESVQANLSIQWTKGKLSFYQASIPDIYKMLERHFNVRIQIDSEELKDEYFLGSIHLEMSLSEILSYLDVDKKYKIEIKDDVIIVKKR